MKANRRWTTKELRLRDSHVVQRRTALAQLFHSQARLTLDRPAKQALGKLGERVKKLEAGFGGLSGKPEDE